MQSSTVKLTKIFFTNRYYSSGHSKKIPCWNQSFLFKNVVHGTDLACLKKKNENMGMILHIHLAYRNRRSAGSSRCMRYVAYAAYTKKIRGGDQNCLIDLSV